MKGIVIHKNAVEGMYIKTGTKKRGIGVASQLWGGGGTSPSYAIVKMNSDGTFDILTGSHDRIASGHQGGTEPKRNHNPLSGRCFRCFPHRTE